VIDRDLWLKALDEANIAAVEVDPEWVSVSEYATEFGLTDRQAYRILAKLEAAGKATSRSDRRRSLKTGRALTCTTYRLVK